jgi:hypothetical protein
VDEPAGQEPPKKAVTCLAYECPPGKGHGDGDGGGATTTYVYLGSNVQHFLRYIQQELGMPDAQESAIVQSKIDDLTDQRVSWSGCGWLWGLGRGATLTVGWGPGDNRTSLPSSGGRGA